MSQLSGSGQDPEEDEHDRPRVEGEVLVLEAEQPEPPRRSRTTLVLAGFVRFRGVAPAAPLQGRGPPFHAWTIVLVLLGILTAPGQWLIDLIFLHLSFLHARMCVMALLPLCTLAAVLLRDLAGPRADDAPITRRLALLIAAAPVARRARVVGQTISCRAPLVERLARLDRFPSMIVWRRCRRR